MRMDKKIKLANEENIRQRLIKAIQESGISQTEIAKKANITSASLSDYIHKGKLPSLTTFALICKAIDISADEILGII